MVAVSAMSLAAPAYAPDKTTMSACRPQAQWGNHPILEEIASPMKNRWFDAENRI